MRILLMLLLLASCKEPKVEINADITVVKPTPTSEENSEDSTASNSESEESNSEDSLSEDLSAEETKEEIKEEIAEVISRPTLTTTHCQARVLDESSVIMNYEFEYSIEKYSTGQINVFCRVITTTNSTQLAQSNACVLYREMKIDNPYGGRWTFAENNGLITATYFCTYGGFNCGTQNTIFTFEKDDCSEETEEL